MSQLAVNVDASEQLEWRIKQQCRRLAVATTAAERVKAWTDLSILHAQRSPERVAQLERDLGLR